MQAEIPWVYSQYVKKIKKSTRHGTYESNETSTVTEGFVGEEGMQYFDNRSDPLEQFGIALPEFFKSLSLFLEHIEDRIGTVAAIDLGGE